MHDVDSQAVPPPLPPNSVPRHRGSTAQTLLYVLVILALCGLLVEGCFIYHLYRNNKTTEEVIQHHSILRPNPTVKPPKPMAHLSAGVYAPLENGVMIWDDQAQPVVYKMEHKKRQGQLIIQKEGYYSIYAKVCYSEDYLMFTHSVVKLTNRYPDAELELLRSRTYAASTSYRKHGLSNSYLAGVFHLFKDDIIFVRVSNHTLVRRTDAAESFFGAYMH
ncbi:tumor necrosis factor ligand superfamily member 14-like [Chanos chanos]|uniref:Tumor necrosis factor ligand superfamily member 14-like n=1 Tax=Chanos chanos TaxID=29144 RepID=A0A6J2WQ37_CHACN|nr:tumor necrosis factor ligand superfamily member 14-like [Chanos chanos]